MRFEAVIRLVKTRPRAIKDGGSVTIVELTTETVRSICGDLVLLVGDAVTIELNPQQFKMVEDIGPAGERVLVSQGDGETGESEVPQQPADACGICGHPNADHLREEKICLGDSGACTCVEWSDVTTCSAPMVRFRVADTAPGGDEQTAVAGPADRPAGRRKRHGRSAE